MATFTIDLLSGKVFLFNKDFTGSGGTGGSGSTYQEVNLFSQLPAASSHNGEIYVVRTSSGNYVLNRKEAGLYYSNGSTWRRLGDIPSFFSSTNFQVYDGVDNTKGINIQTSGITSGVFRTLTVQNSSGTIAYLTDLNAKVNTSAFADYTGTTAPNTYLSISDFDTYSGVTYSLILGKQDQLTAGKGITISTGNTISVNLPNSIQLTDISGGTEVNTIPHTPIIWTTQEYSGTSLNFTGGSRIYILETGLFELTYVLNLEFGSGGDKNIGTVIKKNGNTLITQMTSSSFLKNGSGSGSNTMPAYKVNLTAGDYVELVGFRIGSAGSVLTLPNGSWIKINKLL
jgi:hypothetical protein